MPRSSRTRSAVAIPSAIVVMLAALLAPASAAANAASAALRARAATEIYNLDREQATETLKQAVADDPADAAAYRMLASTLWLGITFRRGNMTVDDYLGNVNRPRVARTAPPAETVAEFQEALEHSLVLSRKRTHANPRDVDAHYELGAAVALRASYIATVDNSTIGAFRAAREAYEEHEKVLELDQRRKDAGLVVGTYRYIVSALAMPLRWVAYVAGFGGGREKGLEMVESAASYDGDNSEEARFTLIVLYNREKRYLDALNLMTDLRARYPKNRLLWLETASTSLRAGRAADAERTLDDGFRRFAGDTRPRMFGEPALWQYKLGLAKVAVGKPSEARDSLQKALTVEGRPWVHGRAHLELGKLDAKGGNRGAASEHFREAIRLSESDNDLPTADEARGLLN